MTAVAPAAGHGRPNPPQAGPAQWRRLIWVTWRQHRSALAAFAIFVVLVAIFIAVTGVVLHGPGPGVFSVGPNSPWPLFDAADTVLKVGLPLLPVLAGLFIGAPLIAREIETGTAKFAWVQAAGRSRLLVASVLSIAVFLAFVGLGLGFEYRWWATPMMPFRSNWIRPLFVLRPVPFAGWFVLGFSLGVFYGALIRRTLAAMGATLASYLPLLYLETIWQPVYLPPLHETAGNPTFSPGGGFGYSTYLGGQGGPGPDVLSTALGWPDGRLLSGSELDHSPAWFRMHDIQIWLTYQPGSRFLLFQYTEFGWLFVLSAILIAATLVLIRRRAA